MTISTIATVIPLYNKEPYIARAIEFGTRSDEACRRNHCCG